MARPQATNGRPYLGGGVHDAPQIAFPQGEVCGFAAYISKMR